MTKYVGSAVDTDAGVVIGSKVLEDADSESAVCGVLPFLDTTEGSEGTVVESTDTSPRADAMNYDIEFVSLPRNKTPHVPFTSSLPAPQHLSYQGSQFLFSRDKGRTDPDWHRQAHELVESETLG